MPHEKNIILDQFIKLKCDICCYPIYWNSKELPENFMNWYRNWLTNIIKQYMQYFNISGISYPLLCQ